MSARRVPSYSHLANMADRCGRPGAKLKGFLRGLVMHPEFAREQHELGSCQHELAWNANRALRCCRRGPGCLHPP